MTRSFVADVALATCRALPEPDPDAAPLVSRLGDAGVRARLCAWDDPTIDWAAFRLTILRSTWNYYLDRPRFLRWAQHVDRVGTLCNPLRVVRWNTHKRYLCELAQRGVPVIPTELISRSDRPPPLRDVCDRHGWEEIVVKPAVSAASFETHRMGRAALDEERFARLCRDRDVLVQPFVASVHTYGERAVVAIDGELTHSVRKQPRFGSDEELVSTALPIADDEREVATAALASANEPLLYGRVDLARDAAGAPMVMELELTEPSLFLIQSPAALTRFVESICRRLRPTPNTT